MTGVGRLLRRVRDVVRPRQADRDLRDQITGHLEEAVEEHVRRGLSPAEARRAALLEFGSVVQAEETCRDIRGRWLQDVTKDIGYGLRSLRRFPGFAVIAVLSLALGIGANTTIFSLVNSILLRPRPVADPERLVELFTGDRERPYDTCSYPSYVELRDRNEVLSGLAAYAIRQFRLGAPTQVEQVWGEAVSGNYFEVLGVQAQRGRPLVAADDLVPGGTPIVVVSHGLWQRRFSADPNLVGRSILINGHAMTVAGIAPPQYSGMMRGIASELWVPVTAMPLLEPAKAQGLTGRGGRWLALVGRLKPGATIEQARARLDLLSRDMQASHPEEWRPRQAETGSVRELFVSVLPERDTRIHPDMRGAAYALTALLVVIINLVLVIACTNLASMLLARAVGRRKEIAIRLAIGASRWRIVRQLLTESVLVALVAGAGGVVLTVWLLNVLLATIPSLPEGIRVAVDLRVDLRVLAYGVAFSILTGALFGLLPALQSSRPDVSLVLKDDSSAVTGRYRRLRSLETLIVVQVALSVLLLIGAGLTLRSLERLRPTRLGFTSDNIVVAPLELNETRYDRARSQAFYSEIAERVSALPGVQAVSLVDGVPGGFGGRSRRSTEIEGYQAASGESLEIDAAFVGPRYFTNMKFPFVQGRDIDERDRQGAPCAAVVNEAFARRYLAGSRTALGRRLAKRERDAPSVSETCEIVGVIRDDRWQSLQKVARPFYALAVHQSYRNRMYLLVHTAGDPAAQVDSIRRAVLKLEPGMPVTDVQTLAAHFDASLYPFRVLGIVMGASGALALLLALIGIYGIVAYATAQRTREMGIRVALGAVRSDILGTVVGYGMRPVAIGLAVGLLLSVGATRVLTSSMFDMDLLYGVGATDGPTFAYVTVALALTALLACAVPALKAASVDPVEALRSE